MPGVLNGRWGKTPGRSVALPGDSESLGTELGMDTGIYQDWKIKLRKFNCWQTAGNWGEVAGPVHI
jgi:hypothetical protein